MSYFNQGNVWGRVIKANDGKTRDKGTPFLELEIDCTNPEYGHILAFGRLWGKEKIAALKAYLSSRASSDRGRTSSDASSGRNVPADSGIIRLKGFYDQYEENTTWYSSYTFYDFIVPSASQALNGDTPPSSRSPGGISPQSGRAAFILVGDLEQKELIEGEPLLHLTIMRKGADMDREQDLKIWLFDPEVYYEIVPGDLIEVRGILRKRESEDFYGGASDSPIRPYAMTTKKRVRKE
jgi:hypothetical protein